MKHIINPFKFERNSGAFLESNITTVDFFTVGNDKIPVVLTDYTYIDYREPFNKSMGFDSEYLRCMSWDEATQSFANDG